MNVNNQGSRQADSLDYFKAWWNECPIFTKSMIYICSTVLILQIFIYGLANLFVVIPIAVIKAHRYQTLFLSAFYNQGLLGLIFGFLVFLPHNSRKEREWGTVKNIFDFFYKNLIINLSFIGFAYLMSTVSRGILTSQCFGLWPIYFYYLTERCLQDPNGNSQLMCFPIYIRNYLYPIALFLLFSLFSQMILYDLLVAFFVGIIHYKFLNNAYHGFLNERRMLNWENSIFCKCFRALPNYVSPSGNMFANRGQPTGTYDNESGAASRSTPSAFNAFQGKGITLGGTDEQPYVPPPPQQHINYAPPLQQGQGQNYTQFRDENR